MRETVLFKIFFTFVTFYQEQRICGYMRINARKQGVIMLVRKMVLFCSAVLAAQGAAQAAMNLKSATGTVLIAAPTAENGPTAQGVWFLNPADKTFSLSLPTLPSNKVYEGWIVDNCTGKKFSTGIFRADGKVDSDAAGMYAGPLKLDYPPFPGSDFVMLKNNITDGSHVVVITVEPYPDMDANPSSEVVMRVAIPENTMVGTELMLENVAQ